MITLNGIRGSSANHLQIIVNLLQKIIAVCKESPLKSCGLSDQQSQSYTPA